MIAWTAKIKKWLESNAKKSELIRGSWEVEVESEDEFDVITARNPTFPFKITIFVSEHVATLAINTGMSTDEFDVADRMKMYKKMLHLNADYSLVKTGLLGEDDEVVVLVDFDLASLSRQEFFDGLSALLAATYKLMEKLDLEEEFMEAVLEKIAILTQRKIEEGASEEDVIEFLVKKVGMKKKEAKQFLAVIMERMEEDRAKEKEKVVKYIG